MRILYLSAASSESFVNELYQFTKLDPGFAVQKFNRLLIKGFIENGEDVTVLTAPPVGPHSSSKLFWNKEKEEEKGITYNYLSFINFPVLRHMCIFLGTFIRVIQWSVKLRKESKAIVCDVLNATMSAAAIWAGKMLRVQIIGVMTDMPELMVNFDKKHQETLIKKMAPQLIHSCLSRFDKYVFLTSEMNSVNQYAHPYIVMEGMSDETMSTYSKSLKEESTRIVMYAGGLHERYGLRKLVEAFMALPHGDIELHLYGSGPFVHDLKNDYCLRDTRIRYMGVAPTSEVIKTELSSTLLVNPRPTDEEFTKYSFPSKNIEYMASGTPLLTTNLPGMPIEYHSYVYLIDNETIEGYTSALNGVLSKSSEELYNFGSRAKAFVLENKNCCVQAKRVIELIKS